MLNNSSNDTGNWSMWSAVLLALVGTAAAGCPPDWRLYEGSCYFAFPLTLSWTDANNVCKSLQSDLASVHSAAENTYLVDMMFNLDYFWCGLNDISEGGDFQWTDGSTVTYTNWYTNEPSGTGDCVGISGDGSDYMKWNDLSCTSTYRFVCKMPEPEAN